MKPTSNRCSLCRTWLACGICLALAGGCASPGKKTATGAGVGAVGGAAVGAAIGGGRGAAIGAVAGAATGAAVGNYLDRQAQELAKVAETHRTENGIIVRLQNALLFETASAQVKKEALTQLNQLGQILAKYPDDRIRILGHTDNVGDETYNEQLSSRRADAVRDLLDQAGVRENQMLVLGLGERKPVASNQSESGRSKNRRVELVIDVPEKNPGGSLG